MSFTSASGPIVLLSQQEPNIVFEDGNVKMTLTCSSETMPEQIATFHVILQLEHAEKIGGQLPAAIVQVEVWRKSRR